MAYVCVCLLSLLLPLPLPAPTLTPGHCHQPHLLGALGNSVLSQRCSPGLPAMAGLEGADWVQCACLFARAAAAVWPWASTRAPCT